MVRTVYPTRLPNGSLLLNNMLDYEMVPLGSTFRSLTSSASSFFSSLLLFWLCQVKVCERKMFETNFTSLDWGIVIVYLVGTGILGMFVNKYIHNASDYLVGGRSAGTSLSIASFIGTGLGLVTLMYASMGGFNKGFSFLLVPTIAFVAYIMLGSTGFVIKRLREMKLTTLPEFFEKRFSRKVRVTSGIIAVLAGILNMGIFPKMGAIFITYVTGMGGEQSELTVNIITSLLIVLVLVYTVMGGMVAVMVTDYIQFVVLSIGLGLGLWFCFNSPGLGWDEMVTTWSKAKGAAAFNPVHEKSYGWTYLFFQIFVITFAGFCWAPEATRALTTENSSTTKKTFLFGAPGFFVRMAIPAVWGIAAFVFVSKHPELKDVFFGKEPIHAAAAMPLLLGNVIPMGLLGLLVAGLLAAFMSTHDSYLLSWASIISQDIIAPLKRVDRLSDQESIFFTRVSVVVIGAFLLFWGIWYELPESVWDYMSITGTVYVAGSGVALIGGMYWKRASSTGALLSMFGGLFAILGLKPIVEPTQFFLDSRLHSKCEYWLNGYSISLSVFGICALLFIFGSLAFPDKQQPATLEGEIS
ncbi:hypothetical protein MNBD_PLANCTO02-763 [hydrothermal vent metagenome]|uniref:Sodium:solute symporter family protein n=1 Tax=hydrothermal vent metagenome TaxID=652676 RepID=A0A3B1E0V9_9ZZZZ